MGLLLGSPALPPPPSLESDLPPRRRWRFLEGEPGQRKASARLPPAGPAGAVGAPLSHRISEEQASSPGEPPRSGVRRGCKPWSPRPSSSFPSGSWDTGHDPSSQCWVGCGRSDRWLSSNVSSYKKPSWNLEAKADSMPPSWGSPLTTAASSPWS